MLDEKQTGTAPIIPGIITQALRDAYHELIG